MSQTFFFLMSLLYYSLTMLHPIGASIQGDVLTGNVTDILLLDVTLLSLIDNSSPVGASIQSSVLAGNVTDILLLDVTLLLLVDNACSCIHSG
jgi:molecular chaperone DnaK (HSP70)